MYLKTAIIYNIVHIVKLARLLKGFQEGQSIVGIFLQTNVPCRAAIARIGSNILQTELDPKRAFFASCETIPWHCSTASSAPPWLVFDMVPVVVLTALETMVLSSFSRLAPVEHLYNEYDPWRRHDDSQTQHCSCFKKCFTRWQNSLQFLNKAITQDTIKRSKISTWHVGTERSSSTPTMSIKYF